MATDELYESCLPILSNDGLEDEDKTERVEDLLRQQASLTGKLLETSVLDILWRYRNAANASSASPAITLRKSASPAPWQMSRSATPTASPRSAAASPAPTSLNAKRPGLFRVKSSNTGSPFSSPRPSPSLLYAAPRSIQTPSPNPYDFGVDHSLPSDMYADYASDTSTDWLAGDKAAAGNMSSNVGYPGEFVPGAADWMPSQAIEMSPYEILRSVLRDQRSDEEIEKVLEANAYDLSAAMASLMEIQSADSSHLAEPDRAFLVGKSLAPSSRPSTPSGQAKSSVVCRYWLQTGQCLRADCKFSHDLSNHICKYWLQGNCLAGDSCIFSHDPSGMLGNLAINNSTSYPMAPSDIAQPTYEIQDYESFPSLGSSHPGTMHSYSAMKSVHAGNNGATTASTGGTLSHNALAPEFIPSGPPSRPGSRHQSPAPRSPGIAFDDADSFPSLSAAAVRATKKHHGKRGHGHGHREKDNSSSSLADVVRNAPNPPIQPQSPRRTLRGRGAYSSTRENSAAVNAIPSPEHIPWLETGDRANKAYLKARQEAIRHGNARNKFLQSAAQAWHRQDVRAAKALSLRGQSENDLMRDAHRSAADALYEERNKLLQSASTRQETYIDLHGLHPAEAVSYLSTALSSQRATHAKLAPRMSEDDFSRSKIKFLYAIVGTGHHSRSGGAVGTASGAGGKDKVGRAVRSYLSECGYAFKEFSAPQEQVKGTPAPAEGILGIDVVSGDASRDPAAFGANAEEGHDSGIGDAEDVDIGK